MFSALALSDFARFHSRSLFLTKHFVSKLVIRHSSTHVSSSSQCHEVNSKPHEISATHRIRGHRPKRIMLVRHGESMGNVDENLYATVPDNQMPLSEKGREQSREAGVKLKEIVGDERIKFFVSPYNRTRETYLEMIKSFPAEQYSYREEPRLREQDFGNFQNYEKILRCRQERKEFGVFYYRFPEGESGADVYDRVSTFIETLHREFVRDSCAPNFVLVTHGLTARLFLMRYFHWEVEKFERSWNLENCQIVQMVLQPHGSYQIAVPLPEDPKPETPDDKWKHITAQLIRTPQRQQKRIVTDLYDL